MTGFDDDWQVQFFCLDSPLAGPSIDPDADGQVNLFEFTAGLVPTDPNSVFATRFAPDPGQPALTRIAFGPIAAGRSYTILASPSLASGSWQPLRGRSADRRRGRTDRHRSFTGADPEVLPRGRRQTVNGITARSHGFSRSRIQCPAG